MAVLIFDLDGTLVNSFEQITQSANKVRIELGFPGLSSSVAEKVIGLPAFKLFEDLMKFGVNANDLVPKFRETLKTEIKKGNSVYAGAISLLSACKQENIHTAIATSKPQRLAELVVEHSELIGLIDIVQGTDEFPPKPDPTVINKVLQTADDIGIMFGDRPEDMQAAKSAGIPAVGIAQSIFSQQMLMNAGASITFPTLSELYASKQSPLQLIDFVMENHNGPKIR
jgi:phosphoglycolate phosphatase